MTVVLLITVVWLSLGIGVIVLYNVVKSQYARRGDLAATALAALLANGPHRTVVGSDRSPWVDPMTPSTSVPES